MFIKIPETLHEQSRWNVFDALDMDCLDSSGLVRKLGGLPRSSLPGKGERNLFPTHFSLLSSHLDRVIQGIKFSNE